MNKYKSYSATIVSLLLGVFIFLFFSQSYPYHLHYQEQFQLFLFRSDYFFEKVTFPGGLADYISRFFVQFFYISWLGALVIALLLVLMQRLIAQIVEKIRKDHALYILTALPPLGYMILLCDENYMLTGVIAMLFALTAIAGCLYVSRRKVRLISGILLIPIIYWFAAGAVWVFIGLLLFAEKQVFRQLTKNQFITYTLLAALVGILSPLTAKYVLQLHYPLPQLWWTMGLHRYWGTAPYSSLIVWILVLLVPIVYTVIPSFPSSGKQRWAFLTSVFFVFAGTALMILLVADTDKEKAMGYDYNVRMKRWDQVIEMAEKENPRYDMAISCLNLALGMKGELGNRMFHFYQKADGGLFPSYTRDSTSPLPTAEIFYNLGFMNAVERYVFEAMEAIPDYQKSARCIKRLAEVNLINGHYEVAHKYMQTLQYTLFYRSWATDALTYLYNEKKINNHAEWGPLRANCFTESFFFQSTNMERMLAMLTQINASNTMASAYLLAYPLINKDLDRFYSYYQYISTQTPFDPIPTVYQETLLYLWSQQQNIYDEKPWPIRNSLVEEIKKYAQLFSTDDARPTLAKEFGNTYWYYLHFGHEER